MDRRLDLLQTALPESFLYIGLSYLVLASVRQDFTGQIPNRALGVDNLLLNFLYLFPYQDRVLLYDLLPVSWAVRWELMFYLLVTLALALRLTGRGLTITVSIIALASLVGIRHGIGDLTFISAIAATFCIGSLVALAVRDGNRFCAGIAVAVLVVLLSEGMPMLPFHYELIAESALMQMISLALLSWRPSGSVRRFDVLCGDLSYPVYILHLPVGYLVKAIIGSGVPAFTIATVVSLCVAFVANNAIERPMRAAIRSGTPNLPKGVWQSTSKAAIGN